MPEIPCGSCWAWFINPPSQAAKFVRQYDGKLTPMCYGCWSAAKCPKFIPFDKGLDEWTVQQVMAV